MTNLVVRRSILICVVLSPMWLGYTRAASEERRPATDHELQLARTVTEFLRSWCEKRDPEAAADFLSAEAFIAECGSREDDSEVPQADKVRAQYVEAFSDALRNLLDPGSLSDLISAPVDPGFPPREIVSHPRESLFQMVDLGPGTPLRGMICKGSDRRPFVVEALSQPGLRVISVELRVRPDLLEELRQVSEDPELVVEFVFIWRQEHGSWKLLAIDLARR